MIENTRSKKPLVYIGIALIIALGLLAGLWYTLAPQKTDINAKISSGSDILYAPPGEGFKRVTQPRAFTFPEDNGSHPEYQTEWWYYTGNLTDLDGRRFGYQLTFFRHGLSAAPITRTSEWATNESYLAHFTITDIDNNQFHAFDQASRGAAGLAGATSSPLNIFVEGWSATGDQPTTLRANRDGIGLELDLSSIKAPTLQGDGGVSPRSSKPGDASYYYSLTRMETNGTIRLGEQSFTVEGYSWFDHEWSTGLLDRGQVGWDWFGIHLDDGQDIKWGQIRQPDGSLVIGNGTITGPASAGREGGLAPITVLQKNDLRLTVLEKWTSPHTGAVYPSRWRMEIPKAGIDIEIKPFIPDQELRFPLITYWEGAISVAGSHAGRGYAELTGYGLER